MAETFMEWVALFEQRLEPSSNEEERERQHEYLAARRRVLTSLSTVFRITLTCILSSGSLRGFAGKPEQISEAPSDDRTLVICSNDAIGWMD